MQLQQDVQHNVVQHVDGEQRHAARDDVGELAAAGGVAGGTDGRAAAEGL